MPTKTKWFLKAAWVKGERGHWRWFSASPVKPWRWDWKPINPSMQILANISVKAVFVTDFLIFLFFYFVLRLIKTMAYHGVFSSFSSFSPFFCSSSSSPFYRSITKGYNKFFFLFLFSSLVQNTGLLLTFSHHWNQWDKHSFFLFKDTSLNKVRYWWLSVLANY